jgi:GNAT superfamily N-acetyltransferase
MSLIKDWNPKQAALKEALAKPERFKEAIRLCLELHGNVHSASVSNVKSSTIFDELWDGLSREAFETMPGGKGVTIDWNIWHITRIEEVIRRLNLPNWHVYKIFADGVLCGGLSFCERLENPGDYYLVLVFVLPEFQNKGIASTAIKLCEAEVKNARRWTLGFPVDEPANRCCYEKAGNTDTGQWQEQSGGAIILAIYEKKLYDRGKRDAIFR